MSPSLTKYVHWLRQPTTLMGLSMLFGGLTGAATHALSAEMATTLLSSALPLLLPDNSTARALASSVIPPAVMALEKTPIAGKETREPG